MLSNAVEKRLSSIPSLSQQGKRINGLFRLMQSSILWEKAYEDIASNKGALTKGVTNNTLDGFSLERVQRIIDEVQEGSYRFRPARRVYIPKANGKKRPLGIPTADDKLVQSAVKILLELIYEPVFSVHSHGFRKKRSCHTALKAIKDTWTGVKWLIDIDIVGYFDNIDHNILLQLLAKKIDDKRFLRLIKQMLRAGYLEHWVYHPTYSGTPQGGVISPILANIYLHELDQFMERMKEQFDKGKYRRKNPDYNAIQRRIYTRRKEADRLKEEHNDAEVEILKQDIRILEKQLRQLSPKNPMDDGYRRLLYSRYADDSLIGIIGSKADAKKVMEKIISFLSVKLNLQISKEKSSICKADKGSVFLGYKVQTRKSDRLLRSRMQGRYVTRRVPSGYVQLRAPVEKLEKFVEAKRYGNYHTMRSTHRGLMIFGSDAEIVMSYNAEMRGLANYYKLATLWKSDIGRVHCIWWFSLMKTLANKHRSTVKRTAQHLRDGNEHIVRYVVDGKQRSCKILRLKHVDPTPVLSPKVDIPPKADWIIGRSDILDRLNARVCEACGTTNAPMEVHHVRKLADVKSASLLQKVKAARQRKRIVLCHDCHQAIHKGELSDMRNVDIQTRRAG